MFILGDDNLTLRCDSCGSQLGMGRKPIDAVRARMPSGWLALDKGRHSCSICSAARHNPMMFRVAAVR